jgi:hypothetical protein
VIKSNFQQCFSDILVLLAEETGALGENHQSIGGGNWSSRRKSPIYWRRKLELSAKITNLLAEETGALGENHQSIGGGN